MKLELPSNRTPRRSRGFLKYKIKPRFARHKPRPSINAFDVSQSATKTLAAAVHEPFKRSIATAQLSTVHVVSPSAASPRKISGPTKPGGPVGRFSVRTFPFSFAGVMICSPYHYYVFALDLRIMLCAKTSVVSPHKIHSDSNHGGRCEHTELRLRSKADESEKPKILYSSDQTVGHVNFF